MDGGNDTRVDGGGAGHGGDGGGGGAGGMAGGTDGGHGGATGGTTGGAGGATGGAGGATGGTGGTLDGGAGGCTGDGQCGSGKLCVNNACVPGNCRTTGACTGGLVCTDMTCSACTADNQCGGGNICLGGVCIAGNCHTTASCGGGQVCNLGTHACAACGSDAQCADPANYGAGNYCQNNVCVPGQCRTANDCTGGKLCNASLACVACATTAECTTALGSNHLCVSGACVSGSCTSTNNCTGGGQLCQSMSCVACTTDASCTADPVYGPQHLCLTGQCVAGNCRTSADCATSGQVCDTTTHTCGACGSDTICKNDARYGNTTICLGALCTSGDCHDTSTQCQAGQICGASSPHTCGTCSTDTQCVNDTHYGAGNICYQGACTAGNCHATSSDCTSVNAGLICGVSSANTCGPCGGDGQCKSDSFYGNTTICQTASGPNQGKCVTASCASGGPCAANGGDFCCGGQCVAGNCCGDADCGTIGTACLNHTCSACNAITGNRFLVDPVGGNDSTATGSGMSGSTAAPGCAFKTITRAMMAMGATPPAGTRIVLVGTAGSTTGLAAGDVLPIILPTNVTLTTQGGPITVTLATTTAGNPAGFRLRNTNSAIGGDPTAPLVLDGNSQTAGIGILVDPTVATNTASVSNVTVQNTGGDGIRVSTGILNIGAGVVVTGSSQDGLRVLGTISGGAVTLPGVANITVPAGQTPTVFSGNATHGIEVTTGGSVNVTGVPGAPVPSGNGTVVVTGNTTAGIRINQTSGTTGLATSNINGLVSWANTNYGARIFAGSMVKLRNSIFLANAQYGVLVSTAANTVAGNDLSGIDLGTLADFGHNYLQTPLGALGTNATGGLCVALNNYTGLGGPLTVNLNAAGNFMVSAGNGQVDCSSSTAAITKGTCGGMRSSGINAATAVTTTTTIASCM